VYDWCVATISQGYETYAGAGVIAIAAAIVRVSYTTDGCACPTPRSCLFVRFLAMGLPLTMLAVHVGHKYGWSTDDTIMASSVAAFLSRELLELVFAAKRMVFARILRRFNEYK